MVNVLGIGINTMDIYRQRNRMYPGGNEYNIAWHIQKLGGNASFIGAFAVDPAGVYLRQTLLDAGVDLTHSTIYPEACSGYAIVELREGDRVFVDWNRRGATDLHPCAITAELTNYAKQFDMVCVSHCARLSVEDVCEIGRSGASVCYDMSNDFTAEEIIRVAPFVRIAFFSASDLTDSEAEELLHCACSAGCPLAVATRGDKDSMALCGGQLFRQPCTKAVPLDTMGAGDSFISAFLFSYIQSRKEQDKKAEDAISQALRCGAQYSSDVIGIEGSLGIGYDINVACLGKYFNLKGKA